MCLLVVCVFVCADGRDPELELREPPPAQLVYDYMYVCMYVCMYVYIYICIYVYICTDMYICIYIYIYISNQELAVCLLVVCVLFVCLFVFFVLRSVFIISNRKTSN